MIWSVPPVAPGTISIRSELLIRIDTPEETLTFGTAWQPVVWGGLSYAALGSLLSIGTIQHSTQSTGNTLAITISGLPDDPDIIGSVFDQNLRGSRVQIWRAFSSDGLDPVDLGVYSRFVGQIQSFSVEENESTAGFLTQRQRDISVTFNCSSQQNVLDQQRSGRRTNDREHRIWYPNDPSMSRTMVLRDTTFDFGRKV